MSALSRLPLVTLGIIAAMVALAHAVPGPVLNIKVAPLGIAKMASAPVSAPGAGQSIMFLVPGTNAGSCKLQIMAGTSTTPSTIIDNIGAGC